MQKVFILIFIVIFAVSCNNDRGNSKQEHTPLTFKRIDVTGLSHGQHSDKVNFEISGYEHYIAVENFDEDNWDNFWVDYADKYIDTCTTNLPIWAVTFCRPFDYQPHGDSRDLDPLQEHAIVSISYGYETLHKKYPDIVGVEVYNNGKATYIQTQTLNRAKDKGYYDSSGNLKTEFIKEMDEKFHTNFFQTTKK
jgi:hypothetical protein